MNPKSKLKVLIMTPSIIITFYLSTYFTSSSVKSLIILLIEGVIGYSSFAAMIVTVVIIMGIYAYFVLSFENSFGPQIAINLSKILTAISHVSRR
jgi:hypothetical protein